MFTVKSSSEFLADIRAISPNLKNLRINAIQIDRKEKCVRYDFICDKTVDKDLLDLILKEAEKITSPAFRSVKINVKKIVSDSELVSNSIIMYLNANYPSIAMFLKPTDLSVVTGEGEVRYTIKLTKDGIDYVNRNGILRKINEYLAKNYCSDFLGSYEEKQAEESISLLNEEVYISELQKIEHRTIKVKDVVIVDDLHMGNLAIYIEDVKTHGAYTVCGKVTEITEKQTAKGKPMFIINITDTTGSIKGVYFTKKATCQKIRDITVGECIIARVSLAEYNGKDSFTFDKINRCTFPTDFVKKEKFKKSAPSQYSLVYPKEASTIKVNSVFEMQEKIPDELVDKTFVVFDIETTGLDVMSNGITEIGAVKIVNGKVKEEWSTLVKPDYNIDAENFKITGISNEMVKDSPKFPQVIPDFMKFIEGATLVAHNADFDMKFMKRFSSSEDYEIKNEVVDNLAIARKCLPQLRKHDLGTLAEYFGVVFHHHRALADAYATAEIFIELLKIREKTEGQK